MRSVGVNWIRWEVFFESERERNHKSVMHKCDIQSFIHLRCNALMLFWSFDVPLWMTSSVSVSVIASPLGGSKYISRTERCPFTLEANEMQFSKHEISFSVIFLCFASCISFSLSYPPPQKKPTACPIPIVLDPRNKHTAMPNTTSVKHSFWVDRLIPHTCDLPASLHQAVNTTLRETF